MAGEGDGEKSSSTSTATTTNQTVTKNVVGHIEPYVLGDEYTEYMERMDMLIALNEISDEKTKVRFCFGFCGPDLFKIIKMCIAPVWYK